MNKNLQMVYKYHYETKHQPLRYAKSIGYMDWDTRPDPFRSYQGANKIQLPLALKNSTPEYRDIFAPLVPQGITLETISQFFQFSLGLAAIKVSGDSSWTLRCNASSGNLHPSEGYLVTNSVDGIEEGVYHYAPKNHNLELLAKSDNGLSLPKQSFLVAISSIAWREAWKYGERAWRYTQLDCGHARRALEISAFMLGWSVQKLDVDDGDISSLIGLDQSSRYLEQERECPDMLLLVSMNSGEEGVDVSKIREQLQDDYYGKANKLSPSWHKWDIIEEVENATKTPVVSIENIDVASIDRVKTSESKSVVMSRRSAQRMDKENSRFSYEQFESIVGSVALSLDNKPCGVSLVIFVHNVENLQSGLYVLVRNGEHKKKLQELMKDTFLWEKNQSDKMDLYLLQEGNYQEISKTISCSQSIASDGAFCLGMLAQFTSQLEQYGAHRYKELYWECGAIGQQLYLEAEFLGLSATGIGCFLDDIFHQLLELKTDEYQSLYHFTLGRGIADDRLSNIEPYSSL